ncbi:hypothetical protein AWH56_011300 [Anaerobacillus isosaccharinicus]|uniref:Uncharacterized protein n=1 Tax=Anaerobacillus isosaccharinicus TaxID=1532552 RepID=A0A1S2MFS9_9BACI|nr:hypothetical protein [Anaerobacillus isosaccharinicus]MBA5588510.1 hypothetical protein [Anaerobacillus isosaccharinicus]QOY38794.1 hypothetical protein AWH56_011300 [Anaerobacillus isosaccharinicus]
MGGLVIILPFMSIMIGLYLITLGLWELREGVNRNQYIKYMFTGLFLLLILTPLLGLIGNFLNFHLN